MKSIFPLIATVIVAVGVSVMYLPEQSATDTASEYAFEALREQASQIDRVAIENAEGTIFSAQNQDGKWRSTTFAHYPVDTEALSDLLQAMVNAKRVEPKTAKSEHYARLGVEALTDDNAGSVLVNVYRGDNQVMSVLVGNSAANGDAYIRHPEEQQSWLINTELALPVTKVEWLAQPIVDVSLDSVVSLTKLSLASESLKQDTVSDEQSEWVITRQTAETSATVKAEAASNVPNEFRFIPTPDEATLKYPSILRNVVNSLLTVNFDGLQSRDSALGDSATVEQQYQLVLNTGESIDIQLLREGEVSWLMFSQYNATPPQESEQGVQTAIAEQSERLLRWRFKLTDYDAKQWNKSVNDFYDFPEKSQEPSTN